MSDEKPATKVVSAGRRAEWTQGVVNTPVWRASTHLYESVADLRAAGGRDTQHRLFYGRRGGPTQWSLADALTELEPGAEATFLYPSGVAAIAAALLASSRPATSCFASTGPTTPPARSPPGCSGGSASRPASTTR